MCGSQTLRIIGLTFLTVATLAGCGGGGGGSVVSTSSSGTSSGSGTGTPTASAQTAYLVDAPVQGASYKTSSGLTGITGSDGSFQYASGDTVSFSVLGLPLGNSTQVPSNGVVTPATITGEVAAATAITPTNAPKATAIAQFLQTLSQISANASGSGGSGALVMPTAGTATAAGIQSALSSLHTTDMPTIVSDLQAALNSAMGSSGVTVVPASTAIAKMNASIQAAASAAANGSDVGTVWALTCVNSTCGGGTLTLLGNGTAIGVTPKHGVIYGTWIVNSDGSFSFDIGSPAVGEASGTLPAGQTSCASCIAVIKSSGTPTTASLSEVSSGTATSPYNGLWYATDTPTSAGGSTGGTLVLIAEPNGSIIGIDDTGNLASGTWTSSGAGTITVTSASGSNPVIVVNFATLTGSVSKNGTAIGTVTYSRTAPVMYSIGGTLKMTGASTNCVAMTLTIDGVSNNPINAYVGYNNGGAICNNPGGNMPTTNGLPIPVSLPFTFSSLVPAGAGYAVSIPSSQPGACTVSNASGTATGNVNNLSVSCN